MHEYHNPEPHNYKPARPLSMALAASAIVMSLIGVAMPDPAAARDKSTSRQEVVRFHDLDLTKMADTERLNMRIRRAAKHVCDEPGIADLVHERQMKKCAKQAYGRAWAEATSVISNRRLAVSILK